MRFCSPNSRDMNWAASVAAARNSHIFSPFRQSSFSKRAMSTVQADWIYVPERGSTPPYSIFSKPIQKSPEDDRDYRIIKLANGLNAAVIHDPTADKAAASLDVAVGHLYDPVCLLNKHLSCLNY